MGYGYVRVQNKLRLVHRVRYEREIGPIPDGLGLDHYVCDNGPGGCCNPHHCRPASQRENSLRGNGIGARYAARSHCQHGHPLTPDNLIPSELRRTGARICLTCHKANQRRIRTRKVIEATGKAPYVHGSPLCRAGLHPLAGGNLMACSLRQGRRECRACRNAKQRIAREQRLGRRVFGPSSGLCRAGLHPLSGDNLVVSKAKRGRRVCRACVNDHRREKRNRKTA